MRSGPYGGRKKVRMAAFLILVVVVLLILYDQYLRPVIVDPEQGLPPIVPSLQGYWRAFAQAAFAPLLVLGVCLIGGCLYGIAKRSQMIEMR